jgi:hypothetical protein
VPRSDQQGHCDGERALESHEIRVRRLILFAM